MAKSTKSAEKIDQQNSPYRNLAHFWNSKIFPYETNHGTVPYLEIWSLHEKYLSQRKYVFFLNQQLFRYVFSKVPLLIIVKNDAVGTRNLDSIKHKIVYHW